MNVRLISGLVLIAGIVVPCLFVPMLGPMLGGHDPNAQNDPGASKLRPPGTEMAVVVVPGQPSELLAERVEWQGESLVLFDDGRTRTVERSSVLNPTPNGVDQHRRFLLGTDQFGRDLFARLLQGGRVSLSVALLAGLLSISIGVGIGALRALGPGFVDKSLGYLTDALLAFPDLVLVLLLAALFRPSLWMLIALVGTTGWMGLSRIVRGELESLEKRDWVLAARAMGQKDLRIFWRHLLPNISAPVLVDASLRVGAIILLEAALSFLGFGVQPPDASWGTLIADGRSHMVTAWWIAAFPGLAITVTVLGLFLLAEGVETELSPRRQKSRLRHALIRPEEASA